MFADAWQAAVSAGFGGHALNLGVGGRVGYTAPGGLYVGANFDYFFSESKTSESFQSASLSLKTTEVDPDLWMAMVGVGYDMQLRKTTLMRPFLGGGVSKVFGDVCDRRPGESETCYSFGSKLIASWTVGASFQQSIGPVLFGPDVRLLFVDEPAVAASLLVGAAL